MRISKIFEKKGGKPLKRIEAKVSSKNSRIKVRASRTSGVNAAIHPFRGLTFNTKHGLRLSKTFKGLTLGFQRKNFIVRGWWRIGDNFNLNLSKSGFSFSVKSDFGTFNFKNPNRSSFKFAGIQIRGKKAKNLAFIFAIPNIIMGILNLALWISRPLIKISFWLLKINLYIFGVLLSIVWTVTKILAFLLYMAARLAVNICIVVPYRIIKNFLSIFLIDIPIQLINHIADREILFENEPDYRKIKSIEIENDDAEALDLLRERLKFYDEKITEPSNKEKIYYWLLLICGFLIVLVGGLFLVLGIIDGIEEGSWLPSIFGIYLMLIGNEMKEPIIRLRRKKQDFKLKEEFNILYD